MTFLDAFAENVRRHPDKIALEFLDPPLQRLTYAELDELVERTATYLGTLDLQPGDRVALQLSKCLEFILLHLATLRLRAISLPLNPAYPPDELKYFLEDSGARVLFALPSSRDRIGRILADLPSLQRCIFLNPAEPQTLVSALPPALASHSQPETASPSPDDTAVIIYTSGTTGRPKGAEITHDNLAANLHSLHEAWAWTSDDTLLHVLPLFHVHGLFVALWGALHAGATTLLMREFEPRATLRTLVDRRCTVLMAVPTIHRRLLDVPEASRFDLSSLRLITSGSDRLPDEVFERFQRTFGYTLLERYGLTETGMNCTNPLRSERKMGSVGLPLPHVQVRVADPETGRPFPQGEVGEVQVSGPNVFKGYWRQPEKTLAAFTSDGWFRTGDLGLLEPDGYLTLCGRAKDLIITGGMNVYPPEVERVLNEHPAVAASAVIGCPDRDWGERVTAVVVLAEAGAASSDDLIAFCRQKLAAYKAPKSVLFREDLPRNAMGKVQKTELRAGICAQDL